MLWDNIKIVYNDVYQYYKILDNYDHLSGTNNVSFNLINFIDKIW